LTPILLEWIGIGFLVGWLALETAWDLWKSVVLPIALVLPPVIAGIILQAFEGRFWLAAAAAIILLAHLSGKIWVRALGTGLFVVAALLYGLTWTAVGFGLYWLLWELNVMGGADALAIYAVLLILPNQNAFWSVLAGIFVWALAALIITQRRKLWNRFRQMFHRLLLGDMPSEQELETEGQPTMGGVWLGVLFYAAVQWWGAH
jgi:hypothetical protein